MCCLKGYTEVATHTHTHSNTHTQATNTYQVFVSLQVVAAECSRVHFRRIFRRLCVVWARDGLYQHWCVRGYLCGCARGVFLLLIRPTLSIRAQRGWSSPRGGLFGGRSDHHRPCDLFQGILQQRILSVLEVELVGV
jgi:hypothetical protein